MNNISKFNSVGGSLTVFRDPAAWFSGSYGTASTWSSFDMYPRLLADINGDGKADIVGFGEHEVSAAVAEKNSFVGIATVSKEFCRQCPGNWKSYNSNPRLLGDVNGDGMADIVGFGATGVYAAFSNNGYFGGSQYVLAGNFGTDKAAGGWESYQKSPRLLGDVNGDGMADIVGFGEAGVFVAFSRGYSFQTPVFVLGDFGTDKAAGGWESYDKFPRLLGDVNGDGMADIVGFAEVGVLVALSKGISFQDKQSDLADFCRAQTWETFSLFPRFIGDVDGDKKYDIVGFAARTVTVALSAMTGPTSSPSTRYPTSTPSNAPTTSPTLAPNFFHLLSSPEGNASSTACTITNRYYGKYLTTEGSYFSIYKKGGYFYLDSFSNQLLIKQSGESEFLMQDTYTEKYISTKDGIVVESLSTPIKQSYWDIRGDCDFITKKLYNKFSDISEMSAKYKCSSKIIVNKVSLVTQPFDIKSGDSVDLSLSCGHNVKKFTGKFTAADSVNLYNEPSLKCDSDVLDIHLSVNDKQHYTYQIPSAVYFSYPPYTKVRYPFEEQDLNGGNIEVVNFWGDIKAICSAAMSAVLGLDARGTMEAGCEALVSGSASADTLFGLISAVASTALTATCKAYLSIDAAAKTKFDFEAKCTIELSASGGFQAKKICMELNADAKTDIQGVAKVLSIIDMNVVFDAFAYLKAGVDACAFVNHIAKYVVDITYAYDDQPYCYVPQDMSYLTGQTVHVESIEGQNLKSIMIESGIFSAVTALTPGKAMFLCQDVAIPCVSEVLVKIIKDGGVQKTSTVSCGAKNAKMSNTIVTLDTESTDSYYSLTESYNSPQCTPIDSTEESSSIFKNAMIALGSLVAAAVGFLCVRKCKADGVLCFKKVAQIGAVSLISPEEANAEDTHNQKDGTPWPENLEYELHDELANEAVLWA